MRDYQTKANQGGAPDSITSTKLGAGEANSILTEAKTAVERAGLTVAGADGAGEDTTQLAQAIFINSVKASTFVDSGSANAYQLTPVSGSSGVLLPGGYGALNGMRIYFVPSANNTGNTTINIGQTVGTLLGSKKALTIAGGEIPSGALLASRLAAFTYDASADGGNGAWILDGSYDASGQFLPLTGGTMTGPIAMGSNKITGLADGTATGDAVNKQQMDAAVVAGPHVAAGYSNLRINVTGNATVDVDADFLTVFDVTGNGRGLRNVNLTLDLGTAGANGRDTGSEAANTWYAVHVIYNPTTDTVAGLLSTSATSPTLPSGYTFARRIGWVRNDGSSNLYRTMQRNEKVAYILGANPATPRTLASGVAGNVTTPTWVSVPVGNFVPPTAKLVVVHLLASGTAMAAPNKSYGDWQSRTNPPPFVSLADPGGSFSVRGELMLESSNLEWASNNANNYLYCSGWDDNL